MTLGPVMLDLAGAQLDQEDVELLAHPAVGGVILFTRNYHDPLQLAELVAAIHAIRKPRLLVAVDHEGGRVQRFREHFTLLPALAAFGRLHDDDPQRARTLSEDAGWLLAVELRACGVDLSFAPVLDLRSSLSAVIGDRAFHADPECVATLARAMMRGMRAGGMAAVGKHFPGHGSVAEDSHVEIPIDRRALEAIRFADMVAFERMIHAGLPAIMPAHVVYPEVDRLPAGFSPRWLREILRGELGFNGAVFSDDLCMTGAAAVGDMRARAVAALDAGCDMLLVCNDRDAAIEVIETVGDEANPVLASRLTPLHGRGPVAGLQSLRRDRRHADTVAALSLLQPDPELDLEPRDRLG